MKTLLLLLSLFIASANFAYSQVQSDSISVYKVLGHMEFYHKNEKVRVNRVLKIIKANEEAYRILKSARPNYVGGQLISFIGGALIGVPLGTALRGGEPNWAFAGIGAAFVAVSIPVSNNFNQQAKKAISIYNNSLVETSFWDAKELNFTVNNYGVGLVFKF